MGLQLDTSRVEFFLWMGITLPIFGIAGKIPVENDKLQILQDSLIVGLEEIAKLLPNIRSTRFIGIER